MMGRDGGYGPQFGQMPPQFQQMPTMGHGQQYFSPFAPYQGPGAPQAPWGNGEPPWVHILRGLQGKHARLPGGRPIQQPAPGGPPVGPNVSSMFRARQDLRGGITAEQFQNMLQGHVPGHEHGDFVGLTNAQIQALADQLSPSGHGGGYQLGGGGGGPRIPEAPGLPQHGGPGMPHVPYQPLMHGQQQKIGRREMLMQIMAQKHGLQGKQARLPTGY